jgi:hypothetical protein
MEGRGGGEAQGVADPPPPKKKNQFSKVRKSTFLEISSSEAEKSV